VRRIAVDFLYLALFVVLFLSTLGLVAAFDRLR
jgi:hypothetical protein